MTLLNRSTTLGSLTSTSVDPLAQYGTNSSLEGNDVTPFVWAVRTAFIPIWLILMIFGVVGNGLTIRVLCSPRLRQSSTTLYLTLLSIVDLLYLLTSLNATLINFIFLFPNSYLTHRHSLLCKMVPFLSYSLSTLSVWLLVAVTVDRMIWVVLPFRAKQLCSMRNAIITSSSITVIIITMHGQFLANSIEDIPLGVNQSEPRIDETIRQEDSQSGKFDITTPLSTTYPLNFTSHTPEVTQRICSSTAFGQIVVPYLDFVFLAVLPFIFMLFANSLIIHKLHELRRIRRRNFSKKPDSREQQRNISLITMLLANNLFFMVAVSPLLIYDIAFFAFNLPVLAGQDPDLGQMLFLIERSVYTLWYIKFCVHFLLYCLSGPRFRVEAIRILGLARLSLMQRWIQGEDKRQTHENATTTVFSPMTHAGAKLTDGEAVPLKQGHASSVKFHIVNQGNGRKQLCHEFNEIQVNLSRCHMKESCPDTPVQMIGESLQLLPSEANFDEEEIIWNPLPDIVFKTQGSLRGIQIISHDSSL